MALTTAEVTTVSRNSRTRRIREDTQGHDQRANQVQQDTGGPAGILKDTSPRRFGTVRPRVQIPGPRPISENDPGVTAHAAMAMDHSWITISRGGARTSRLHWRIWECDWVATSSERLVGRSGIRATGHARRIPKGLAKRRT